jgi:hypothetical protein
VILRTVNPTEHVTLQYSSCEPRTGTRTGTGTQQQINQRSFTTLLPLLLVRVPVLVARARVPVCKINNVKYCRRVPRIGNWNFGTVRVST